MKGGPRARSGPPPDPQSGRSGRTEGAWTVLPAAGREGDPPAWPLARPTRRELTIWRDEWKRPQSVQWEAHGQAIEVALYVRTLVAAEKTDAPAATRTLVRQQQEALGLSQPGLLRLRWLIGPADATPPNVGQPADSDGKAPTDVRERFRVVA